MPEITVPSDGTVKELVDVVDTANRESYHVRVKDDNVRITQTDDERYADHGNIYPQGASTWLQVSPGNALYAVNAGSTDATVEVDQSPAPAAVTQDPAASGTSTVTDDGNFNLAGNQDVDIAEQSLAALDVSAAEVDVDINSQTLTRLASAIEATNGTSYDEIRRVSNAMLVNLDGQQTTINTEQQTPIALEDDGGTAISTTNPLSVDAPNTLPVEQQTPVQVEDSGGTNIDPKQQGALDAEYTSINLNSTGTTTIYNGSTECYIGGVYLNNSGGTAEVQLEVTDGTNTAVLQGADDGAGVSIEFGDTFPLNSDDDLQMNVTKAEGSSLSETAVVFREEL